MRSSRRPQSAVNPVSSPGSSDISLEDVLSGARVAPYTKANFMAFLESELAEENLEFVDSVKEYKGAIADGASVGSADEVVEKAQEVVDVYIHTEAPKQVNISSDMRSEVIDRLAEKQVDGTIFDEAEKEVKTMMGQGPFIRFLKSAVTENISQDHANWRKRIGEINLVIAVTIMVTFMCLQGFTDVNALDSRFYRLLGFPFLFTGISYYQSGKRCVCSALAVQGVYMSKKSHKTWWEMYGLGKKNVDEENVAQDELENVIQDPYAREQLRKLGVRYFYESIILSVISMVIIVLLPPGDDIYPF
mmetsp:Transcript_1469/g.1753  ORF Transcript_1469/g.1753 Transcript_1469/m.1753 type:complete len:304 (+) Transcript_1469:200-1111(+)